MLKQIKMRQASIDQDNQSEVVKAEAEEPKITFEEYEAFLKKLEKEKRLEKMEITNPRSALYQEMMSGNSIRRETDSK